MIIIIKITVLLVNLWLPQGKNERKIYLVSLGLTCAHSVQFSGSVQLCNPVDCSTPGFPVHHQLPELAQAHVHRVGGASNHLILCHPFLLLPSLFSSIRVFSNDSVLPIRWPKYWGFSFSISPSNEYSGLISFRIDWLDLLAVQGTLKNLLQHHSSQFFNSSLLSFLYSPPLSSIHDHW